MAPSLLLKLIRRNTLLKEEQLAVCYWTKQVLGLACGVAFAFWRMRGFSAIATYSVFSLSFTWYICQKLIGEEFDEQTGIQEGFLPSLGLFLLTWIVTHTMLQAV
uniref:Rab5-interacting protein n=1 Tax=Calcidiscus leptoporus TaxID=127549 RepID=A0A7S0IPM1_9EUKA|mmetsp:Transcript_15782/g.36112  ORF Transcript_15782/g.36112 Transcript_15782/m.36112 type:complete len:105 (+) Transcript_15782:156-470(+)